MIKKIVFLLCFTSISLNILAQEETTHDPKNETEKEPGFELIVSGVFINATEKKHTDFATEMHLTYWTSHKWAFGVGYTLIFEDDNRIGHEVAALISHKPWSFLTLNAGPSFSLPNSHKETKMSAYLEAEFAFKLGDIHTGPTIGSLMGEEFKVFGGWHFSYEF